MRRSPSVAVVAHVAVGNDGQVTIPRLDMAINCGLRRMTQHQVRTRSEVSGGSGRFGEVRLMSTCPLAQIPPADLHIPGLGQLAPTQLPLGDALKPGPLEVVCLNRPLGGGAFREQALKHAPRGPGPPHGTRPHSAVGSLPGVF
jgi:hypothetical protein